MKLHLGALEIDNFKCFRKASISLADRGPGVHFVCGRNVAEPRMGQNAVGKSSIWDALTWVLYGKTLSGLRTPDLLPRGGGSPTQVALSLDGATIRRQANPNLLLVEDSPINQEALDDALQMGLSAFGHTILLGQGQPLFFDLRPQAKMDLFSEVLNLERWERRAGAASDKAKALDQDRLMTEAQLVALDESTDRLKGQIEDARANSEAWEKDRTVARDAIERQRDQLKARHEKILPMLTEAELAYDQAATELKAIKSDLRKVWGELDEIREELTQHRGHLQALKEQRSSLQEALAQLGKGGRCPTCGKPIDKGSELARHKAELEAQLRALEAEIEKGLPKDLMKRDEALMASRKALAVSEADYEAKAEVAKDTVLQLAPEAQAMQAKLNTVNEALNSKADERNPYTTAIRKLRDELKGYAEAKQDLKTVLDKLERQTTRTRFWVKGFREVRLYVVEEVLRELEVTTNAMLEEIGLVGWEVKYAVEKETKSGGIQRGLSVMILSPSNDKPVRWETWSGGEGQRLRLAGSLALSQVLLNHAGIETDMDVLDEPTQFLSADGVNDLCNYLAERARMLGRATFFTSHQAIASSKFASTITVVKDEQDGRALSYMEA